MSGSEEEEQLACWNVGAVRDPRQLEAVRSREDGGGGGVSGGDGRLLEKDGPRPTSRRHLGDQRAVVLGAEKGCWEGKRGAQSWVSPLLTVRLGSL